MQENININSNRLHQQSKQAIKQQKKAIVKIQKSKVNFLSSTQTKGLAVPTLQKHSSEQQEQSARNIKLQQKEEDKKIKKKTLRRMKSEIINFPSKGAADASIKSQSPNGRAIEVPKVVKGIHSQSNLGDENGPEGVPLEMKASSIPCKEI